MRNPIRSGQFKRDVKAAEKRGKNMEKLRVLLVLLIEGKPLPPEYLDHPLKGGWKGYRDSHIEPDWLLIYPTTCILSVPVPTRTFSVRDRITNHFPFPWEGINRVG